MGGPHFVNGVQNWQDAEEVLFLTAHRKLENIYLW